MRVAIDARCVQPPLNGVGRHVLNVLMGLSQRDSDLEFLILSSGVYARKWIERFGGPYRGRLHWISASSEPGSVLEQVEIPMLLRLNKASLFHDIGSTGVWTGNVPKLVTLHELSALYGLDNASPEFKRLRQRYKRLVRGAKFVVSVSQSLGEQIQSNLDISAPKIRVVYNCIDPRFAERVNALEVKSMRERFNLEGEYYLCVTADKPTKNVGIVRQLAYENSASSTSWVFTLPGLAAEAADYKSASVRDLGRIEDLWLRPLYSACRAVIVPSLYEGFSLPPIESLALGAIPVVSDIAPHREILSGILPETLFFDPKNTASLKKSLESVGEGGTPLRTTVFDKFRSVSDRFSLIETTNALQNVYREALK